MQEVVGNTRRADLTFYPSGRIDISSGVARLLSLRQGDVIGVLVSDCKEEPDEMYLHVRRHAPLLGRHEGAVFQAKSGFHSFRAYSGTMARKVISLCRGDGRPERVRLSVGEPVKDKYGKPMLPIIYKNLLP